MESIKSKPATLDKITKSKYFHIQWEKVQKAMTAVLDEADATPGNMNTWIDACNAVKHEMDQLQGLGWSVRHGATKE